MSTPPETPIRGYQIPPLGQRILTSGLLLVPLIVVLVGLPVAGLAFLQSHGISLPISYWTVAGFGFAIAVLVAVRSVLKPTAAYGPAAIATSGATLAYLLVLFLQATYHIAIPNSTVTLSVDVARLLVLLMLVPAFGIVAGVVTTVEDARHPAERLPFDFPA